MGEITDMVMRLRAKVEAADAAILARLEQEVLAAAKYYDESLAIECPARKESTFEQTREILGLA